MLGLFLCEAVTLFSMHFLVMRSPGAFAVSNAIASQLSAAVCRSNCSESDMVDFLRVSVELPAPWFCPAPGGASPGWCRGVFASHVYCDLASERAWLELPEALRERAFASERPSARALSARLSDDARLLAFAVPGLAMGVVSRLLLSTLVHGPLRREAWDPPGAEPEVSSGSLVGQATDVLRIFANLSQGPSANATPQAAGASPQERPANATIGAQESLADPWSLLSSWGSASLRFGGSSPRFPYISCQGQRPRSSGPLRRAAELAGRDMEAWIFKGVWMASAAVFLFTAGAALSFSVRCAGYGALAWDRALRRPSPAIATSQARCATVDGAEAAVLMASPLLLALALCRALGDAGADYAAPLLCLAIGELVALVAFRTAEARYLFPRMMLPVYVADVFYTSFHSFGFTALAHSALFTFQAFAAVSLWSHFELRAPGLACAEPRLSVEARLRPLRKPPQDRFASPPAGAVRQLLVDQALLLAGGDHSTESGIVLGAIIGRVLQSALPEPSLPASAYERHPVGQEARRLGGGHGLLLGGAATQALIGRAFAGDEDCEALLRHLLERLPASVWQGPLLPPETLPTFAGRGAVLAPPSTAGIARPTYGRIQWPATPARRRRDASPQTLGFDVTVHKSSADARLGIDVDLNNGRTVVITAVRAGLILDWNREHPERRVQADDQIVRVNGVGSRVDDMLVRIRTDEVLELSIVRHIRAADSHLFEHDSASSEGTEGEEEAELVPWSTGIARIRAFMRASGAHRDSPVSSEASGEQDVWAGAAPAAREDDEDAALGEPGAEPDSHQRPSPAAGACDSEVEGATDRSLAAPAPAEPKDCSSHSGDALSPASSEAAAQPGADLESRAVAQDERCHTGEPLPQQCVYPEEEQDPPAHCAASVGASMSSSGAAGDASDLEVDATEGRDLDSRDE